MSSAQISEQETNAALPAPEPQISLPEPEKPKGSGFTEVDCRPGDPAGGWGSSVEDS